MRTSVLSNLMVAGILLWAAVHFDSHTGSLTFNMPALIAVAIALCIVGLAAVMSLQAVIVSHVHKCGGGRELQQKISFTIIEALMNGGDDNGRSQMPGFVEVRTTNRRRGPSLSDLEHTPLYRSLKAAVIALGPACYPAYMLLKFGVL